MEKHSSLNLGVAATEKGAFGLPWTAVAKFTFTYIYEHACECTRG